MDESYTVDTRDHEDHTFNGIMFDLVVKELLPVQYLEVTQIWVRGYLGPVTVWMCEGSHAKIFDKEDRWTKVFDGVKEPSAELAPIDITPPLSLPAGTVIGLYVHTSRPDDRGIVYDNQRNSISHEDNFIKVTSGCAHLVSRPFDSRGNWGWGWRPKREFVGRLSYGVKYLLWKPAIKVHSKFPPAFERATTTILCCSRRRESPLSALPKEVVFFVINMCGWNWFGGEDEVGNLGYGSNSEDQYANSDLGGRGIGWRTGNYRALIHEHMRSSEGGRRFLMEQYQYGGNDDDDDDEEDEDEDDSDYEEEDESDGGGQVVLSAEQVNRFLQYVLAQRANVVNQEGGDEEDDSAGGGEAST